MNKPLPPENARAPLNLDFGLSTDDLRTEAWSKIFTAIEARIWKLRMMNDRHQDEAKTAAIRTEIKVLIGIVQNDPDREFSLPRAAVEQDELAAGK